MSTDEGIISLNDESLSDVDSSAEELQLLQKLRSDVRGSYEGELTMRQQLSKYEAEISMLKQQLSDRTSTSSAEEPQGTSVSSLLKNFSDSDNLHPSRSQKAEPFSVWPIKQNRKAFIEEMEQFSSCKCQEADRIIQSLKASDKSHATARFRDRDSTLLFKKMSREIEKLSAEKEQVEAKLRDVLTQLSRFKKDQLARQERRRAETAKISENMIKIERERDSMYQFIADLFPQFTSGEKLTEDSVKQILISVSKRVM